MGQYWLVKSEPEAYSIDDLKKDKLTYWDGVRNFQARNFLRDRVKKGDLVLFYHSNTERTGIVGIAKVIKEGSPDPTQFNSKDRHYDPKASREKPLWFGVDIQFVEKFKEMLSLELLRKIPELNKMTLLKKGQRLSVQPVTAQEWKTVLKLADRD